MMNMIKYHTTSLRGTKQSGRNSEYSGLTLDCFAPLAMTGMEQLSPFGGGWGEVKNKI